MPKMKIAVVPKPGADFVIEEREIPTPGPGQVRIKVAACGVCASDHIVKEGLMPWIQYPRSPGHEVAGVIDEVGSNVTSWKKGDKVGVGWLYTPGTQPKDAITETVAKKASSLMGSIVQSVDSK